MTRPIVRFSCGFLYVILVFTVSAALYAELVVASYKAHPILIHEQVRGAEQSLTETVARNQERLESTTQAVHALEATNMVSRVAVLESKMDTAVGLLQIILPIVLLQLAPMLMGFGDWVRKKRNTP